MQTEKLQHRFANLQAMKGTRSFHRYVPVSRCIIDAFKTSESATKQTFHLADSLCENKDCINKGMATNAEQKNFELVPGTWVLADYFGYKCPG